MQTFQLLDLLILFFLFFLEAFLSIENAAVIAVLAKKLPKEQQNKAIWVGISSGFILRALVVIFTAFFLKFHWIVLVGGLYLIYLAIHHFLKKKAYNIERLYSPSFWKTVFLIEGADTIFAIDSILTAFAVLLLFYPHEVSSEKIWLIYTAGVLGMVTMRFFSKWMISLLEKKPILEHLAYILVGIVGLKLIFSYFY
jgi:YkoY family integral membrane protein